MQTIAVAIQVWNEEELLPLAIKQLYDLPIDIVGVYDGGCTDNSMEVASKYLRNLKCNHYIKQIEQPHDEYFLNHYLEPHTFNMWHEDLKQYDWILHLDVDEIYSPAFKLFLNQLRLQESTQFNCCYFQRFQMVGSPSKYVWRCFENDPECPVPNNPYHVIRHDYQNRFYKVKEFYYPELPNMDTHPHPINGQISIKFDDVKILHIKRLLRNVRCIRGSTNYTALDHFTDPRNEYRELDRNLIPDGLYEWWNEYNE